MLRRLELPRLVLGSSFVWSGSSRRHGCFGASSCIRMSRSTLNRKVTEQKEVLGEQEKDIVSSLCNTCPEMLSRSIPVGSNRRVGNVFVVLCVDHPFKFSWEVNRMLRELRLEYMGQTVILPDIPQVRRRLWRVRHVVRMDMVDLDEAKAMVGIPEHVTFSDLNSQLMPSFGRGRSHSSPVTRSKANFMKLRRMRLRDILHRDELEKQLLEERRNGLKE